MDNMVVERDTQIAMMYMGKIRFLSPALLLRRDAYHSVKATSGRDLLCLAGIIEAFNSNRRHCRRS